MAFNTPTADCIAGAFAAATRFIPEFDKARECSIVRNDTCYGISATFDDDSNRHVSVRFNTELYQWEQVGVLIETVG